MAIVIHKVSLQAQIDASLLVQRSQVIEYIVVFGQSAAVESHVAPAMTMARSELPNEVTNGFRPVKEVEWGGDVFKVIHSARLD